MAKELKDPGAHGRPGSAGSIILYLILIALIVLGYLFVQPWIASILVAITALMILATIRIQVRRYQRDKSKNNLYPLVGYVFLLLGTLSLILYRLPELDTVFLRKMTLEYSAAWQISMLFIFLGFLYLTFWAWNFIKVRPFLRTYVVFLAIALVVSTLGSLVFTGLIFKIVETNNLELMSQGAQTQQLIQSDRSNTALFIARTIADDEGLVANLASGNIAQLQTQSQRYLENAGLDTLRIYNVRGEVINSPSDSRDVGRSFIEDPLVAFALNEKQQIKSFDTAPGVLTDIIVTRAVHPLLLNGEVVGAIETGYVFDNAYVDFAREKTGLDVTMYTGAVRSATTIKTLNGVSRWVGSTENEQIILENVLLNGDSHRMVVDRLGRIYYSAFEPIRNVNGEIIGMVAVGTPTIILFENTRQQLLSTFLILTLISLLIALAGYFAMQSFRRPPRQA